MLVYGSSYVSLVNGIWTTIDDLYNNSSNAIVLRGTTIVNPKTLDFAQTLCTLDLVKETAITYRYHFNDLVIDVCAPGHVITRTGHDEIQTADVGVKIPCYVLAFKTVLVVEKPDLIELIPSKEENMYDLNLDEPIGIFIGSMNKLYRNYSIALAVTP